MSEKLNILSKLDKSVGPLYAVLEHLKISMSTLAIIVQQWAEIEKAFVNMVKNNQKLEDQSLGNEKFLNLT